MNDRLSAFLRAWAPKVSIVLHCAPEKDEVLAFIAGWMDKRAA